MSTVNLYYVRANDENGENIDLLVEARNPVEATQLWHTHYDLDKTYVPTWVGMVPLIGQVRAIDWQSIDPT